MDPARASIFSAVPRCMRMLRQHTHTHTTPAYAYAYYVSILVDLQRRAALHAHAMSAYAYAHYASIRRRIPAYA
jgi:hypothetical protein